MQAFHGYIEEYTDRSDRPAMMIREFNDLEEPASENSGKTSVVSRPYKPKKKIVNRVKES